MLDGPRWGPKEEGRAEQLVVLCHGVGADGYDLIDLAPGWGFALPHAVFVAPDGPERYDAMPVGRQWFALWDRTPEQRAASAAAAAVLLDAFIDAELARLGLPGGACALVGFSQGAMMALHTGPRRAIPPAAVVAYSGALLAPEALAATPSRPPVLLVHGESDETVPVAESRRAEAALREAGFAVEALYRPRLGHGIDDAGLEAGARFLAAAFKS
jgi:phospholipase/carboxylesterase